MKEFSFYTSVRGTVTPVDEETLLFDLDGPPGSILLINAGEAEMKGVELDITAVLAEGLMLRVDYAHLNSDFFEVIDPLTGVDISDDFLLVAAPENSFNIDLKYGVPLLGWGQFSADINYAWKDEREIGTTVQDAGARLDYVY